MTENDKYALNIMMNITNDKNKTTAKYVVKDSDGIDVTSRFETDDPAEDVVMKAYEDIVKKVAEAKGQLEENDEDDVQKLKDEIASLKIDNKILNMRLKGMDEAYARAKSEPTKQPCRRSACHVDTKRVDDYFDAMLRKWFM